MIDLRTTCYTCNAVPCQSVEPQSVLRLRRESYGKYAGTSLSTRADYIPSFKLDSKARRAPPHARTWKAGLSKYS